MHAAALERYASVTSSLFDDADARTGTGETKATKAAETAELLQLERQRRQLLEARLEAQKEANLALRRENLELASHLTASSQQLRVALRSRDEARRHGAEAASLEGAMRAALSKRSLQASQAMCATLRARVGVLEAQIAALEGQGGDGNRGSGGGGGGGGGGGSGGLFAKFASSPPTREDAPRRAFAAADSPNAAVIAEFTEPLSTPERRVLLDLDASERSAVVRELLALAAGLSRNEQAGAQHVGAQTRRAL